MFFRSLDIPGNFFEHINPKNRAKNLQAKYHLQLGLNLKPKVLTLPSRGKFDLPFKYTTNSW